MFHPLDIFKADPDGTVLWRGAAENFVAARACIKKLALSSPGEYLILDQPTGQRTLITLPDTSTEPESSIGPSVVDTISM
ncbi:MAG: hypothetical protein JWO71_4740 [Candidatus Acidoferrum typicum]|nr:hypothetical protein [Candidatus Acidoferrum typicum]